MNEGAKYVKLVEWSEEDQCFIGSCPELFYGGCHGNDPRAVFDELCHIVDETLDLYRQDGKPLPPALSGKNFVNAMQKVA
jgi:predicted RNase H-like HicB family nuclease